MAHAHARMAARTASNLWATGTASGSIAVAAVVLGHEFDLHHGWVPHATAVSWLAVIVLFVSGSYSVRRIAEGSGRFISQRSGPAAGAVVRLVVTGLGYVLVFVAVLAIFGVSLQHLLIGAGLAGVVLGIAAQQSLANVFASLVLLFARPFDVGDRIQIRSGSIGVLEVRVLGIGLTYVTVRSEDGVLKVPNSVLLASGITQLDAAGPSPARATPETPDAPEDAST